MSRRFTIGIVFVVILVFLSSCSTSNPEAPSESYGAIQITVIGDRVDASWHLIGPETDLEREGAQTLEDMPTGTYELTWGELDGYSLPDPNPTIGTLEKEQVLEFEGVYARQVGTIHVAAENGGLIPTWTLTGPESFELTWQGDSTLTDMPVGEYSISWGEVAGWNSPEDTMQVLEDGNSLTFTGDYDQQLGSVTVDVSPEEVEPLSTWILTGPESFELTWQSDSTLTDMPVGEYSISWGEVAGWNSPEDAMQVLEDGSSLTFTGDYDQQLGSVTVDVSPEEAEVLSTWTLTGPEAYELTWQGDSTLADMPVGEYSISWSNISGWVAPAGEIEVLDHEDVINFVGEYIPDSGTIQVDVRPRHLESMAVWTLSGPDGFYLSASGDSLLTEMNSGEYHIEWQEFDTTVNPDPESQLLTTNEAILFVGEYHADEVISEEMVVLNEDSDISLEKISESEIVFSCNDPNNLPFGVGDVLLGTQGEGYLRRVASIEVIRSEVIVQTEFATFEEVIEEGEVGWSGHLEFDPLRSQVNGENGYVHPMLQFKNNRDWSISYTLAGLLGDFEGGGGSFEVVEGDFNLDFNLDLDGEYSPFSGLEEVHGIVSGDLEYSLIVEAEYRPPGGTLTIPLLREIRGARIWGSVFGIPTWVTPVFDLSFVISVSSSGEMTMSGGVQTDCHLATGFRWTEDEGYERVFEKEFISEVFPIVIEDQIDRDLHVYLRSRFTFMVFDVAGPYYALGPYFSDIGKYHPPPENEYCVETSIGLQGEIGARLKVFKWLDISKNFEIPPKNIPLGEECEPYNSIGTIEIYPSPDHIHAPWAISGPGGYEASGYGDGELINLLPGEYTVDWGFVDGWISPPDETQILEDGSTLTFAGMYVEVSPEFGTIEIDPNPNSINAPWTLTGSDEFVLEGQGDDLIQDLLPGVYTQFWGSVVDWITPPAETQTLTAGGSLIFSCTYFEEASDLGTIQINPNPDSIDAPWTLSGPDSYEVSGAGDSELQDLSPGEYTIQWDNVIDWIAPPGEMQNLEENGSLMFSGIYIYPPYQDEFVLIPGGSFIMGAPVEEEGSDNDERPQHSVTLTNNFYMQSTEVTNQQYTEMVQWAYDRGYVGAASWTVHDVFDGSNEQLLDLDDGDCDISFSDGIFTCTNPTQPVEEATWYGAVAYCDWLSLKAGLPRAYNHASWQCNDNDPYNAVGYRLPTEAEWEYACRAGNTSAFANGPITETDCHFDPFLDAIGWYCGNAQGATQLVRQKDSNDWDLFDMHGNLWEWCNDWYSSTYYSDPESGYNPIGPPPRRWPTRVLRGGCWNNEVPWCRSANRKNAVANDGYNGPIGFRVARSAD